MENKLTFKASMGALVGPGWVPIVNKLYEDAIAIDPGLIVDQVKEKFGGLRFYFEASDGYKSDLFDRVDELVNAAESLCYQTCEFCGSTDNVETRTDDGGFWIKTACNSCRGGK